MYLLAEQSFYHVHVSAFPFFVTGQFFWTFSEDENVKEIVDSCSLFFVEVNSFHLHLQSPGTNFLPVLVEKKITYHEAKLILVVVKLWYTLLDLLLAQANLVEFPRSVGKLGQRLQVEAAVQIFAAGAAT
jgi:hypothetical protein